VRLLLLERPTVYRGRVKGMACNDHCVMAIQNFESTELGRRFDRRISTKVTQIMSVRLTVSLARNPQSPHMWRTAGR
jgi:hypothetical protein